MTKKAKNLTPTKQTQTSKEHFFSVTLPELQKTLGMEKANKFIIPKPKYVKVNVGIGSAVGAGKDYEHIIKNIAAITGQKPVVAKSKKAISNFKLRIGTPNGVSVTLRGKRMYDFLSKLVNVVFPRIRDFRGLSPKAFDGRGNYSVGISEHTVFPEIEAEDISKLHGVQVTIVTSAGNDDMGRALLTAMKFPFKK